MYNVATFTKVAVLMRFVACIANNMHPDQTAPLGEVLSWFIVFALEVK